MYEVLGQIYDEMFEIFEPDVFHFGGDEVKFIWWTRSILGSRTAQRYYVIAC